VTPSLRDLQKQFAAAVYEDDAGVLASVRDGIFPAARHVQLYRHNTFANLTDALAAVYPVVRRLVGDGFFEYAADGFIHCHPPRSGNLHDFGAAFADFLSAFEPAQHLAYLADVARLEWLWHEAFHAADATSLALQTLAAVAPQRYAGLVFRLHPSARLIASTFPILRIWHVNQPAFEGDATVDLDTGPEQLLVVRRQLDVHIESLSAGEAAMLSAIAAAKTLAQVSHVALAAQPDFDFGHALREHVARGTIAAVSESDTLT